MTIPRNFICPITHDFMKDPVLLVEDGHSYEKSALELWFKEHNTSPLTNRELQSQTFVINYNLKSTIEDYVRRQNEPKSQSNFRFFTLYRGRPRNKQWEDYPKLRLILSLLGTSHVGKSCLAANVEYGQPQQDNKWRVTLAVDVYFFYLDQLFEDKYVVIVQINDCPGTDRFEAVSDRHFRNCHGAILMVDTTDMHTFDRLENYWYKQLREKSSFDNIEAVLACNKIDLLEKNTDASYRERFFTRADKFASQNQIPIFNISALRGDNVQEMFHHLILSILQNPALVKILKEGSAEIQQQQTSPQTGTIKLPVSAKPSVQNRRTSCPC